MRSAPLGRCVLGKLTYGSYAKAEHAAMRTRRNTGDIVRPYRCPTCAGWHVGSGMLATKRRKDINDDDSE